MNWRGAGLIRDIDIVDVVVTDVGAKEGVLRGLIVPLRYFIVIQTNIKLLLEQPINHLRLDADKNSISWVYRP